MKQLRPLVRRHPTTSGREVAMGKGQSKLGENVEQIDTEFLQELPEEAKTRILEHYERMKSKLQDLNVECNRLKVDHEQRVFELESQLSTEKAALTQTTSVSDYHKIKLAETEEKNRVSEEKVGKLESDQHEKDIKLGELEHQNHQLELEKNDLCRVLERKAQEIDTLNEEWQTMSKKVTDANQAKVAALSRMEEVETAEILVKHKEERWAQERDAYEQRISLLDKELKDKCNELLLTKQQQSLKFLEVDNELEQKREEVVRLEETISHLKGTNEDLLKRNEASMEKLRETKDMQAQGEEHYRNQIMALEKLVSLCKDSAESAERKEQELIEGAKQLQNLLKQSTEVHKQLETDREKDCAKFKEDLQERNDEISRMAKELEDANTLIETLRKAGSVHLLERDLESISPSAAAAARLLKSGMTLTQLYSEYVTAQENLVVEKEENRRINSYLETIIGELEEKAPVMKKQREDYEKSVITINQLTSQLDNAMQECEKLRVSADDANRMYNSLVRENERQRTLTADLGKQVKVLLKELEQARGRVVTNEDADVSSSEVTSSSQQIISQNLVTFRSIEELQEQNQRILAVVRDLSEQKDEDEKVATDNRIMELKEALSLAQQEFETLRDENKRRMGMMESIIRQRDMYKAMMTNENGDESQARWSSAANVTVGGPLMMSTPMPGNSVPSTPVTSLSTSVMQSEVEKKLLQQANESVKTLQEDFTTYRQQKAENEQILNEQVETSRKRQSTLTLQNAKLTSQLDFQAERFKVLQTNVEGYKKEIAALRDKNQKFATNVIKHEQTISSLRKELMATQEKSSNAEVQSQVLRQERDLLKNVEARLSQERDSLQRDQRAQNLLLANLEAIKNNLERSEFETKTQLKRYIDSLEKENSVLKKKMDDIDNQNRSVISTMERQVNDMRNQRDQEAERHKHTSEHSQQLSQELLVVKNELANAEAKLASSEITLTSGGQPGGAVSARANEDRIRALQVQLSQAQAKIKSLQDQVAVAKRHADEYKNMAETFERNVEEQTKNAEEFQQSAQKELEDLQKRVASQEKMLNETEKEKQDLINENIRVTEESHKLNASLTKRLAETEAMLKDGSDAREAAIVNEQAARADCANQLKIAEECQEKYERELVLHAADVESLTKIKQELDGYNDQLARLQEEAKEAKSNLAISQESWQEQEVSFRNETQVLKKRIADLENQNTLLHQELDQLSNQMVGIQAAKAKQDQEAAQLEQVVANDESNHSPDQLLQVVRFLRKEKDISMAKLEVVQAEADRMRQKMEYTQKQVDELELTLSQERSLQQATVQTATQHAELMRKLENQNLLQDSNKLLRQERDDLMNQLQEAEAKVKKLDSDLAPLQANLKDLTSLRDTLQSEKSALESEVNRWKARTNHLIEQCNKVDPEEQKRLLEERDSLKKRMAIATAELQKLRNQLTQEQQNLAQSQQEVQSLTQSTAAQLEEMNGLKLLVENKDKEIEKINVKVQQLRKLGRKYKDECTDAVKALEEMKEQTMKQLQTDLNNAQEEIGSLKTDLASSRTELTATMTELTNVKAEIPEHQKKLKEAEEKFTSANNNLAVITEKLGSAEYELSEAKKQMKILEDASKEMQKAIQQNTESQKQHQQAAAQQEEVAKQNQEGLASLRTTIDKLNEEIKKQQAESTKQKDELSEAEKKFTAMKSYLQKAKNNIKEKMETVEKLTLENAELRSRVGDESAMAGLRDQYAERVSKLENELKELRQQTQAREGPGTQQELAKLQRENAELQQKISLMQKQLEVKAQSQTVTAKPTMSAAPVERAPTSEAPRTANIRPVQPVRSNTAETRATASIRPMAVTPTTATVTPTATVMPNIMSVTEGETMLLTTMGTPTSQVRPQQQVQIVSPHIDTSEPAPAAESEPTPSTSAGPRDSAASKRPREQTDHEDGQAKRSRPAEVEVEVVAEPSATEASREEDTQARGVAMVEPSVQEIAPEAPQETPTPIEQVQETPEQAEEEEEEEIIVLDDEEVARIQQEQHAEELEGPEEYMEGEQQEEAAEYEEEMAEGYEEQEGENYDEMEEEEQAGEEDEGIEGDEGMQGDADEEEEYEVEEEEEGDMQEEEYVEGQDDDAEIVIVESDNEDEEDDEVVESVPDPGVPSAGDQAAVVPPAAQGSDVVTPQTLPTPRVPGRGERLSSVGRAQLTPFMALAPGGTFEEGDDGIVPSTPTLFVPRRSDGFAEAVSSPQVPQGRFVFGATSQEPSTPQPELAQLASQGALGMDDTRMDLSALDDGSGRSIPSTLGSRTPPTVTVTEVPADVTPATAPVPASQAPSVPAVTESTSETTIPTIQIDEVATAVTTEEQSAPSPTISVPSASATPSSSTTSVGAPESASDESKEPSASTSETEMNVNQSAATSATRQHSGPSSKKPKIHRIVWDAPGQSPGASGTVPAQRRQGTPRPRAQLARRGTPMRGRGMMGQQQPRFPGGQMPPHQGQGFRGGPLMRGRGGRGRPY